MGMLEQNTLSYTKGSPLSSIQFMLRFLTTSVVTNQPYRIQVGAPSEPKVTETRKNFIKLEEETLGENKTQGGNPSSPGQLREREQPN